jgi:hypothetical protein
MHSLLRRFASEQLEDAEKEQQLVVERDESG